MSKQSPIGYAKCSRCGKLVAITPTENYWFHVPPTASRYRATKGQFRTYCGGSGEPVRVGQLQAIRNQL